MYTVNELLTINNLYSGSGELDSVHLDSLIKSGNVTCNKLQDGIRIWFGNLLTKFYLNCEQFAWILKQYAKLPVERQPWHHLAVDRVLHPRSEHICECALRGVIEDWEYESITLTEEQCIMLTKITKHHAQIFKMSDKGELEKLGLIDSQGVTKRGKWIVAFLEVIKPKLLAFEVSAIQDALAAWEIEALAEYPKVHVSMKLIFMNRGWLDTEGNVLPKIKELLATMFSNAKKLEARHHGDKTMTNYIPSADDIRYMESFITETKVNKAALEEAGFIEDSGDVIRLTAAGEAFVRNWPGFDDIVYMGRLLLQAEVYQIDAKRRLSEEGFLDKNERTTARGENCLKHPGKPDVVSLVEFCVLCRAYPVLVNPNLKMLQDTGYLSRDNKMTSKGQEYIENLIAESMCASQVLDQVAKERQDQIVNLGRVAAKDDELSMWDWIEMIQNHLDAMNITDKAAQRQLWLRIASSAVAAIESLDRNPEPSEDEMRDAIIAKTIETKDPTYLENLFRRLSDTKSTYYRIMNLGAQIKRTERSREFASRMAYCLSQPLVSKDRGWLKQLLMEYHHNQITYKEFALKLFDKKWEANGDFAPWISMIKFLCNKLVGVAIKPDLRDLVNRINSVHTDNIEDLLAETKNV